MGSARSSIGSVHACARVAVLASVVLLLTCGVAAAALKPTAHNWPNTPVRHTLNQRVGATTPSFAANLRGGVAVAGNTLETCPQIQNPAGNEVCAGKSYDNNEQNMVYVDVDSRSITRR